jgi:hypothetical protein
MEKVICQEDVHLRMAMMIHKVFVTIFTVFGADLNEASAQFLVVETDLSLFQPIFVRNMTRCIGI